MDSPSTRASTFHSREVPAAAGMVASSALDNDDSDSDVSMSAETDDEEEEALGTSAIQVNPDLFTADVPNSIGIAGSSGSVSLKRKHMDSMSNTPSINDHVGFPQQLEKRPKLDSAQYSRSHISAKGTSQQDISLLPAEIWHNVFTFVPPRGLGVLLRINRSFKAYLDPSSAHSVTHSTKSAAQFLTPDAIWQASRRLYQPGMPAPLKGKSELDMWRMACSPLCQFCGKRRAASTSHQDQWHAGPGGTGVVPVWSFGIVTCGPCLEKHTEKEVALLLSSEFPTPLLAALPVLYFSNELHIISQAIVKNPQNQAPPATRIAKTYFTSHVSEIKREYSEVKTLGSATAEEWVKGLDGRGAARRNDAARWDKWETGGGVLRVRTSDNEFPENQKTTLLRNVITPTSTNYPLLTNGQLSAFQGHSLQSTHALPQIPHHIQTSFPHNMPQRFNSPLQNGSGAFNLRPHVPLRQERTKEQVAEMRAARRTEIERRCMLLEPPLPPGVLAHMGSFQAAMQIVKPLDDDAWELLKPRLISQRSDAEQRENERLAQTRVVLEQQSSNYQDMQVIKSASDSKEQEWDDILQAPLRARIGGYADETIRDGWAGGQKVSKDNCSVFAAQVLIYIRKRFYAELAKDEAAIRAAGREPEMDPPNGPFTRKLTLENMKWAFDTKIKPHTEHYRKELFLCNDCEVSKFYGFEGVIQHYAAKHTNTLSLGSIVVHWKSEWPEYTPFHPEPPTGKSSYYSSQTVVPVPSASVPYATSVPQQAYGFGGYLQAVGAPPIQTPHPTIYQESPGPYYSNPQYGTQYSMHQNGPYAPPQTYQEAPQSYQTPQYSVPPQVATGYSEPVQDYSQQSHVNHYPPTSQGFYVPPQSSGCQGAQYQASASDTFNQQSNYSNPEGQHNNSYTQPARSPQPVPATRHSQQIGPAPTETTTTPKPEFYKSQLQDVAKNARDVWDTINGLKDVPGSVKVYTIIHHILKRSRFAFPENPTLAMIVDGLHNNKDMRKVRNINGLQCKVCLSGSSLAAHKKHFSFPQLVNHFHSVHEQEKSRNRSGPAHDWTEDMVELPDLSRLLSIANAPGMNDQRLKLIADALPQIFAPSTTAMEHTDAIKESDKQLADRHNLPPGEDSHEKYYSSITVTAPSDTTNAAYDNEQYDPRRPLDLREVTSVPETRPRYRVSSYNEESCPTTYQNRQRPHHNFDSPAVFPATDEHDRSVIHEAVPEYLDRQLRQQDGSQIEYLVRRDSLTRDHALDPRRDHRLINSQAYLTNRDDLSTSVGRETATREIRYLPHDNTVTRQNKIFEVVAKISEQAKQMQEGRPTKEENFGFGSEEGELRAVTKLKLDSRMQPSAEVIDSADRFLNQFTPGESNGDTPKKDMGPDVRSARWQNEQHDSLRHTYQPSLESLRQVHEEDKRMMQNRARPFNSVSNAVQNGSGYVARTRTPEQRYTRVDDERRIGSIPEQTYPRHRSPELVDRRFVKNNVIYRDERQGSHGMQRTPSSRFARYESVRLENDRARSRSPAYVKIGAHPGQYRDRSPVAYTSLQEPIYRTRTPAAPAELAYERPLGQGYYRVYADEPRRQPQYVETFEYVRVASPRGDYMIRRPVRETESVYKTYESEQYIRKPVYESRAPISRVGPAYYEEEYDPRHPEPPPAPMTRQIRYQ